MVLKRQVCSFELAKRLNELGVKQNSLFIYSTVIPKGQELILRTETQPEIPGKRYAAFTATELGEVLPIGFFRNGTEQVHLKLGRYSGGWSVSYNSPAVGRKTFYRQTADTEADARAKMLIYILENKLIPPCRPDCKYDCSDTLPTVHDCDCHGSI